MRNDPEERNSQLHSGGSLKSLPVVTLRTTSLKYRNFTFCPHSVLCGSEDKPRLIAYTALIDWELRSSGLLRSE
jgi:hypothetical protein